MSDFTPNIRAFCCHYTSQQICAEGDEGLNREGFPKSVAIERLVCSGKLQVSAILKAFEDGADGVYVVGCPEDKCHNLMGSQRAAKRVGAVRKALTELDVEADRVEMYHLERGFHPEFVAAAQEMDRRIKEMGPSPLKGGKK
ncbi:MAG: hydrogenase iron-sulfur subunit [Proteobacteria bacterium]|nr:hydrogenase iron-sulfur subunit [Pseudomonadota bacterium]MBU1711408.1 hydrogenase iron-sulfur subunit [Pseudomonadota bacterium]